MTSVRKSPSTENTDPSTWQARFEEKFDSLMERLDRFATDTHERIKSVETNQQSVGRLSSGTVGTIAVIIGMIATACFAFINIRVAPIEASIAASTAERSQFRTDIQRIEDDRHRGQTELDVSLQREMRLVSEIVAKQNESTNGRLMLDEKRIDDATARVDFMHQSNLIEAKELRMELMRRMNHK